MWGKHCSYIDVHLSTYLASYQLLLTPSPLYSKLFSSITCKTQSFLSRVMVRSLKRVVSATFVLASSLSSVAMPPSSALRRGVLAASPMMSVITIGR